MMGKKAPPHIRDITDEEEARIRAAIEADPDTFEVTEEMWTKARRGRPSGQNKERITVRIDKDVMIALKGDNPKGWQTRLNAAVRAGLGME